MKLTIDRMTNEEITGWNKNIEFTYNGEGYSVLLNWDTDYGYTIFNWTNNMGHQIAPPEWSKEYKSDDPDSDYLDGEDSHFALCSDLDKLTNEVNA
jgi:hypothetical protein